MTSNGLRQRYPPSVTTGSLLGAPLFRALSKSWGVLQTEVLRCFSYMACFYTRLLMPTQHA